MDMFLAILLATMGISGMIAPVVIWIYRRLGMVEKIGKVRIMDTHERPIPRGGGIPIFLSLAIVGGVALGIDKHFLGILGGALVLTILGILDDKYNLSPYLRLPVLFLAAAVVVASGIGIPYISLPFLGIVQLDQPQISFTLLGKVRSVWILADLFALFWIVGIMNFVNWSKGIDGQLPGIVAISAITIALLSLKFSADITQWPVVVLALITAGAYLGFLVWNFYPQKIMPGYGGGILGGYLLAVLSILSTTKVGTLLTVLGVPLADAGFTIVRRILKKKSPMWGDRGHLHHHLLDNLGWKKKQIAFFYWTVTAILGIIALRLNSQQKFYTMLGVGLLVGGLLLWANYFMPFLKQRDRSGG